MPSRSPNMWVLPTSAQRSPRGRSQSPMLGWPTDSGSPVPCRSVAEHVTAGQERHARRAAERRLHEGLLEVHPPRGESVDVGRLQVRMSVAGQVVPAKLVAHDEQNVSGGAHAGSPARSGIAGAGVCRFRGPLSRQGEKPVSERRFRWRRASPGLSGCIARQSRTEHSTGADIRARECLLLDGLGALLRWVSLLRRFSCGTVFGIGMSAGSELHVRTASSVRKRGFAIKTNQSGVYVFMHAYDDSPSMTACTRN